MNLFSKAKKGFSLIELLVVISIIGILVAMGAVAYSTAQKQARDTKRKTDVKAIQAAQEQHFAKNGSYLTIESGNTANCISTGIPDGGLTTMPRDPVTGNVYNCQSATGAYCVRAVLENSNGNCTGCSASGTMNNPGTNQPSFCVTNLQ